MKSFLLRLQRLAINPGVMHLLNTDVTTFLQYTKIHTNAIHGFFLSFREFDTTKLHQSFHYFCVTLYYLFFNKLNVYVMSRNHIPVEAAAFNRFLLHHQDIDESSTTSVPTVVISLEEKITRRVYIDMQLHDVIIFKPVRSTYEYSTTAYPLFIDLSTAYNSFLFLQIIKYLANCALKNLVKTDCKTLLSIYSRLYQIKLL